VLFLEWLQLYTPKVLFVFRNESTGNWRGVRVVDGKLQAPDGIWSETLVFCVVYPKGKFTGYTESVHRLH